MIRTPFVPERIIDEQVITDIIAQSRNRQIAKYQMTLLAKKIQDGEGTMQDIGTILLYLVDQQK
jgi:hypothetical protein